MGYGVLGVAVLVLDIYAIVKIVDSSATTELKVLWSALVVLLPVVGLIAWWVAGPK